MYDLTFLHTNYTEKSANYDADGADKYHQAPAFDKEVIDLNRPERWIITIPSSDQWLATIGNHWKTIATNGFGDQKPLKNHC